MEMHELPEMTDPPPTRPIPGPPTHGDAPTPLETLIDLLQGQASCTLADTGIAHHDRHTLDRIASAADRESEHCLDHMTGLLQLLDASLAHHPPDATPDHWQSTVRHLTWLLANHQRWHTLADNAAYYRDHPEVASKIAAYETRAKVT